MSISEVELLLCLERQLMDPDFRGDRELAAALLAEEFVEFGSSGRVWTRDGILDLLVNESGYVAPSLEEFAVTWIAEDVRLVTYVAVRYEQRTLRSSIWVRREGGWRMLFHQGTRVPVG